MTLIREDSEGLYAQVDGWICRPHTKGEYNGAEGTVYSPQTGSRLKKGDKVRGSHPAGPVTFLRVGKKKTPGYRMEVWDIIDLAPEAKKKVEQGGV